MHHVMERVGDSVRELETLQHHVEASHLNSLTDRERSAFDLEQQNKRKIKLIFHT